MAYPPVSVLTPFRRRTPEELAAAEDEEALRTQRHFEALQQGMDRFDERARRLRDDKLIYVPGQGYVSPRERRADYALRMGDMAPPGERVVSEYEPINPVLNAMDRAFMGPVELAEGLLAGLSSGTEDSQGFLPEVQKGVYGLVMPERGVDEATRERLYRFSEGGLDPYLKMGVVHTALTPWNAVWPNAAFRRAPAIPTFLETSSGERIRRLLDTPRTPGQRVMQLALP
jgi:hypothetical protein